MKRLSLYPSALAVLCLGFTAIQSLYWSAEFAYNRSEGTYWQTLRQLSAGHPLYREVYHSQLPLFIHLAQLGGGELFGARLVISLTSLLALPAIYLIVRKLGGGGLAGLVAALILALDPTFFHLSHQLTGEGPALALALWGSFCLLFPLTWGTLVLAAILLALAVQVKALMLVAVLLAFVFLAVRKTSPAKLVVFLTTIITINLLCLVAFGWFSGGGSEQLQGGYWSKFLNFTFSLSVGSNLDRIFAFRDYSRAAVWFEIPAIVFSVGALFLNGQKRLATSLSVGTLLTLAILLCYIKVNTDHLVLFTPFSAVAMGLVIGGYYSYRWLNWGVLAALLAGLTIVSWKESENLTKRRRKQIRRAAETLKAVTPSDALVLGDDSFLITLGGRLVPPGYTDFSRARLETNTIDCRALAESMARPDVAAYVLTWDLIPYMHCPGEDYEKLIHKNFPQTLYRNGHVAIFGR